MYIPKRFLSPLHILLAVVVLLFIVFNVTIYNFNKTSIPAYVQNYKSGGESYMITSQHQLQSVTDAVDSEEFLSSLLKELKEAKSVDLLEEIKKDLKEENEAKFREDIRKEIGLKYLEQYKKEVKTQIEADFSVKLFTQLLKSYKVMNELAEKYSMENKDKISEFAALREFQQVFDGNPTLKDYDVKSLLTEKIDKVLDKKAYFSFILEDVLLKNKPNAKPITKEEKENPLPPQYYNIVYERKYSRNMLTAKMKLQVIKILQLQDQHLSLINDLKLIEDPPFSVAHGDGIVVNAGGEFIGAALVTIRQLRETGSQLPIELILNTDADYNKFICETLLPNKFNARCVVIEREIGKELYAKLKLTKFQLKALGFLVTSFDNTIALDADNLPLKDVDYLLDHEPYLSTKFVLWPDLWRKGTSPYFYEIAGILLGQPVNRQDIANDDDYFEYVRKNRKSEVGLSDLDGGLPSHSVESGQMVFSKKRHFKSLLLALFYNIYGPNYYYPLLYQGTPGEGDRETFLAALHVLKQPYHLVNYNVWLAGHKKKTTSGEILEDTTIVQYDPVQALFFQMEWEEYLDKNDYDIRLWPFQENDFTKKLLSDFKKEKVKAANMGTADGKLAPKETDYNMPEVLFLHSRRPKIDFLKNAADKDPFDTYSRRNLGEYGTYAKEFGNTDWELKFHTNSKWFACEGINDEEFWKMHGLERDQVCAKVTKYVDYLISTGEGLEKDKDTKPTV